MADPTWTFQSGSTITFNTTWVTSPNAPTNQMYYVTYPTYAGVIDGIADDTTTRSPYLGISREFWYTPPITDPDLALPEGI